MAIRFHFSELFNVGFLISRTSVKLPFQDIYTPDQLRGNTAVSKARLLRWPVFRLHNSLQVAHERGMGNQLRERERKRRLGKPRDGDRTLDMQLVMFFTSVYNGSDAF